jgi:hypothetical protein
MANISSWLEKGIPFLFGSATLLFLTSGALLLSQWESGVVSLKSTVEALDAVLSEEGIAKDEKLHQVVIVSEQQVVVFSGNNESQNLEKAE